MILAIFRDFGCFLAIFGVFLAIFSHFLPFLAIFGHFRLKCISPKMPKVGGARTTREGGLFFFFGFWVFFFPEKNIFRIFFFGSGD